MNFKYSREHQRTCNFLKVGISDGVIMIYLLIDSTILEQVIKTGHSFFSAFPSFALSKNLTF